MAHEKEDATYADDSPFDNRRLEEMLESGNLPDDMQDLEAQLGYDSNSKEEGDDSQASGGSSEQAGQGETDDGKGGEQTAGQQNRDEAGQQQSSTQSADDEKTANPDDPEKGQKADEKADQSTADSEKPSGEPAAQDEQGKEPDGVLTRDGKHVIPFSVLEQTRRRNQELEQELEQLRASSQQSDQDRARAQQDLDRAENRQQNVLDKHDIDAGEIPTKDDGTYDLESLREHYPSEVVDVLAATNQQMVALRRQVETLEQEREAQAQRERELAKQSIQESIDAIPELAEVQAEGGRRWNMAIAVDNDLRQDADWSQTSNRLRFQEVVHLMNGGRPRTPAEVEAAMQSADQQSTREPSPEDPRKRADERVQQQAGDRSPPPTHSDLPAGQRPAQSGLERLEGMDATQLEKEFEGTDDPDELINRML